MWILLLTLVSCAWGWPPQNLHNQQQHVPVNRRQAINGIVAIAGGGGIVALSSQEAFAATAVQEDFVAVSVPPFAFEIPRNWKVIVKPNPNKLPQDGKIFSAIDFGTGAVLTVVQEQICSRADYALSNNNGETKCDLVSAAGGEPSLFSDATFSKDVTKLLRRHDDRDNAALQGTTALDRVERVNVNSFKAFATTNIPSGGTYQDKMGLDQPYMIARTVQSQILINADRIFSIWLSAPSDEWRKPVVGTKLLQVWASVVLAS